MEETLSVLPMKQLYRIDPIWIINNGSTLLKSNRDLSTYLSLCAPNRLKNWGLVDRTQTFKMPLNFQIRLPIKKISSVIQTYSDACNTRAKEIINLAELNDLKIYILWSGGVDSTAVLTSLLLNSSEDQQKRFVILLTQSSIKENLNYFNNFILGKLKYETAITYRTLLKSGHIIVNGECQDQLYMLFGDRLYTDDEIQVQATPDTFTKTFLEKPTFEKKLVEDYMYLAYQSAKSVGVELKEIWEYIWWILFCFVLQANDVRNFMFVDDPFDPELISQNIITFYSSSKFDQWAMQRVQNHKDLPPINKFYKKESKEYIFAFDKNKEYFDKKEKVNSGGVLQNTYQKKPIMDNLMKNVPVEFLMDYYNPDNFFSKYR